MATTIKTKHSTTAGNSPSSLAEGELAINVADGNFFYGDGSAVKQNFAVNQMTASAFKGDGSALTNVPSTPTAGTVSSSAQLASDISGSFTAASASFSTRVAANDVKVSYTDAAVKTKLNTENVVSGSASNVRTFLNVEDGADVTDTANVQSALNNQSLDIGSGTLTANTIDSTTDIDITTNNEFLRGKTTGGAFRHIAGISSNNRVEVGNTTVDGLELIADPAITASCDVISGSAIVQLKPRLELPKTSTTDGDYYGTVVYFGSNTSGMTAGTIYYYRSTGAWVSAQADSTTTSLGLLGVALGAAASDGVLIQGSVTLNHDPGALGDTLYLSDTNAGRATSTVPSSTNDVVRVVGYCLDASNGQIYFNPSSDHIVHA